MSACAWRMGETEDLNDLFEDRRGNLDTLYGSERLGRPERPLKAKFRGVPHVGTSTAPTVDLRGSPLTLTC